MRNVKKLGTASAIFLLRGGMMLAMPQVAQAAMTVPNAEMTQQQRTVTGLVVDQDGEPIIGASVFEDGTTANNETYITTGDVAWNASDSQEAKLKPNEHTRTGETVTVSRFIKNLKQTYINQIHK